MSDNTRGYPYNLWHGASVYVVNREADSVQLRINFLRWTNDVNYGSPTAVFRLTNPGPRSVIVWHFRSQIAVTNSGADNPDWETRQSFFPVPNLRESIIPAGESEQLSVFFPTEGTCRILLLYSREMLNSRPPMHDGTYEAVGPSVREEQGL